MALFCEDDAKSYKMGNYYDNIHLTPVLVSQNQILEHQ